MAEQLQTDLLWWLIPGELAGMRKPNGAELATLQNAGIGAIVSVMDDPGNLDLYKAAQIPHCWLPTKGGTAPTRAQIETFGQFVDQARQAGQGVAVHCSSGRRRTATFLGAYLILQGYSYDATIAAIAQANPTVELRAAQTEFLQALAA